MLPGRSGMSLMVSPRTFGCRSEWPKILRHVGTIVYTEELDAGAVDKLMRKPGEIGAFTR